MAKPSTSFLPAKVISEKTKELAQLQQQYKSLKSSFEEAYSRAISLSGDSSFFGQMDCSDSVSSRSSVETNHEISSEATISSLYTETIRDIFQQYASIQTLGVLDRMELVQFHRFLRDSGLVPGVCTQAEADVLFCNKNKGKNINFWRWVQILCELSKRKYGETALERLVSETIITSVQVKQTTHTGTALREAMTDVNVQMELRRAQSLTDLLYSVFRSPKTSSCGQMPLPDFLRMCTETHLVPELISKREAVHFFRLAQRDAFSELMSKEEFVIALVGVATQVFKEKDCAGAVAELVNWVERSKQRVKALARGRGRVTTR